jgi:hypothetical protein
MGPEGERALARILADTGRFARDWPQRSKSGARSDLWIGELGNPGHRGEAARAMIRAGATKYLQRPTETREPL